MWQPSPNQYSADLAFKSCRHSHDSIYRDHSIYTDGDSFDDITAQPPPFIAILPAPCQPKNPSY
jgi:hypothetical protein